MNGLDLTAVVLAAEGVVGSYVVPKTLARRQARKAAEAESNVSWVSISNLIVAERDRLQKKVDEQAQEIQTLKDELGRRPPPVT